MTDPTWQSVVLQALNVAQTVLLAYLVSDVRSQRAEIRDIRARSYRVRKGDPPKGGSEE